MPAVYWTADRILEAIAAWEKEHGSLPTSGDWKYSPNGRTDRDHPSARWVAKIFGTWKAAIETHQSRPRKRWKIWTEEEIIEALRKWNEEEGQPPAYNDVSRGDHGGRLPSLTSIVSRFGSFRVAMQAAGFELLPPGVTYKNVKKYTPLPRKSER